MTAERGMVLAPPAGIGVVAPRSPARGGARPGTWRAWRARGRGAGALAPVCADVAAAAAVAGPHGAAGLIVLAALLALHTAGGLYQRGAVPLTGALDELPRLLGHTAVAWCVAAALAPGARPGVAALVGLVAAQTVLAGAARGLVHRAGRRAALRRPRPALVVGTGPAGERVAAVLAQHPEYGMRPVGLVGPVPRRLPEIAPLPVVTSHRDVTRAIVRYAVRDAVFAGAPDEALVRLFWSRGCAVWLVAADPADAAGATGHLWGFGCRRLDPPKRRGRRGARRGKRALDVVLACGALAAAAPVLALCALAVRVADGPGVIFRQERVGEDGRPFTMYKFRTLRPADEREAATRWSVAGDRAMSRVGRLLRRSGLDELPQLWNVLRGDMSLVGPRPERPHFVERFTALYPGYADRHRMPVGLTGLAQVSGLRGDTSIEDRTRFDNLYIETWSLWQDVRIMLRTTAVCLRLGGS
ncbi:exopolysaccharide biosynthesis polyprenyl glycosylphosphotransferase [Streptomyces sp. PT12]|uniref:exopolysaccharide biosynthesis polyprenyl glycosylphosphotransferase n=1 Tax=Streptomyces sp. PT12 TaxID=1510197 RepID=UPI000DE552F0|nr:exopolysaccharide biosynthesis polyprenyl glycosylphosphotransferase [Streptomyces sp. PT12]RBM05602.1 sugar transferase [Streptomyces sp. PT12]